MIIRKITYTSKPDKNMMEWIENNCQNLRAVKGMRKVEFIRGKENTETWGALMYFHNQDYLDTYKKSGPYKDLVKSLSEYADMNKPIKDEVYDYIEV
jgi:quinol monooxygenase YgiN